MGSIYAKLNDRAWLYQKYVTERLSTHEIGVPLNCTHMTVCRALRCNGIHVRNASESKTGCLHPNLGKTLSAETRSKMSSSHIGIHAGERSPMYGKTLSDVTREKIRIAHIGMPCSEATKEKRRKNRRLQRFPKHHTKPELQFETICTKNNLPFRYTGDSTLWIGRDSTKLNPDFCSTNGNKNVVVEVFGNWFHDPALNPKVRESATYEYRYNHFEGAGYKMIVFWESELKQANVEVLVLERLGEVGGLNI